MAEHGGIHPPRWIPIAAAILALLAASTGLFANLRVTQSSATKTDGIIYTMRAADAYSEYDTRAVRQHIYEAQTITTTNAKILEKLKSTAKHESEEKAPLLKKARDLDKQAQAATAKAEHILASHEILEVATTLFEIAIVLVSITALAGSRVLPISAAIATAAGIVIAIRGATY